MTRDEALKELTDAGWTDLSHGHRGGFYNGAHYSFGKNVTTRTIKNYWGTTETFTEAQQRISASTSGGTYCCGMPELGHLHITGGSKVSANDIALVLRYILANEGTGYLRCALTSQRTYAKWRAGLELAGFTPTVTLPSKHGRGRYKVVAYDYIDREMHKEAA